MIEKDKMNFTIICDFLSKFNMTSSSVLFKKTISAIQFKILFLGDLRIT